VAGSSRVFRHNSSVAFAVRNSFQLCSVLEWFSFLFFFFFLFLSLDRIELNGIDFFLLSVNPKGTKPLDREHVNKEYSYKIHKRRINNISIKFKYAHTGKDISTKFNYTGNNRRLQIS
jgi:hypothetical protein